MNEEDDRSGQHARRADPLREEFLRIARRRNAWSDQEHLDEVMFEITSDHFGLWELAGFGWDPPGDAEDVEVERRVQQIVRNVVARGWGEVWEAAVKYLPGNNAEYGPYVRLEREHALEVLLNEENWDQRILDAPVRYFVLATETGKREWHEDGVRRRLFRES